MPDEHGSPQHVSGRLRTDGIPPCQATAKVWEHGTCIK